MTQRSDERMARVVEQLRLDPALADRMPAQEGEIVRAALAGESVFAIAQRFGRSEASIWELLSSAMRAAGGAPGLRQVETGGLGSDTDRGVTGGYGDTGFGSLGNEPPIPTPEEPDEGDGG